MTNRPTVTTLAFTLNAQAVLGHLIQGKPARARALLAAMTDEQLRSLAQVAGTVADLATETRGGTPCD